MCFVHFGDIGDIFSNSRHATPTYRVRLLLYCSYSSLGWTIKSGNKLNLTLETGKSWGRYLVLVVCIFCHKASLNPTDWDFKDRKRKFCLVISFVLKHLFSSHVKCLLLAELVAAK